MNLNVLFDREINTYDVPCNVINGGNFHLKLQSINNASFLLEDISLFELFTSNFVVDH